MDLGVTSNTAVFEAAIERAGLSDPTETLGGAETTLIISWYGWMITRIIGRASALLFFCQTCFEPGIPYVCMKLRTINDVITNSSNEVFIYRSDANPKKVLQELKKILGPNHGCSGMGGVLEVASTPDIREEFDYRESYLGLPAGYLLVNIDYGYLEDLRGWLQENLGEPISDEEEKKLFLPSVTKKNKELLEQLKAITEVTDESMKTFGRWYSSCYDLEVCGGGKPEIPKDKVQLFLDYHEKEYQKLKKRADKLPVESEDWCDLQYEMDLQSGVIKGLKKLLDENS